MRRRSRGTVIAEAALLLPLFAFLALGALDLLWAVNQRGNLDHVAATVASCVKQNGCADPQAAALAFATQLHMPNAQSLQVVSDPPSCSTCTTVTATYTFKGVSPFWFSSIRMVTTATAD